MKKLLFLLLFIQQVMISQAPEASIKQEPIDFELAEIKPVFPGGNAEFSKFIAKNFVTPDVEGLSGVIKVSFVIDLNGNVTDIKVVKDIGNGSGQAAINLMKKSPKWSVGQIEGKLIKVRYILPITVKAY